MLGQPQPQKRPPAPQAPPYFPDQLRYVPSALTAPLALECGLPRPPLNSATSKSKLGSWRYQGLSRTGKDSEPRAAALLKTPFLSRPVPVRLRPPRRRSQLCPETPAAPWPGPHPAAPRRPQRGGRRLPPPAPGGHGRDPRGPGRAPGHGASPTSVSAPDAALRLGVALSPTALHVPGVPRCPGVAHPALACHLPQHVTSSEPRRRVLGDRTALRSRPHRRRSVLCRPSLHAAAEGHRAPGTCARGRRRPPGRPAGEAPPRRPRRACAVQSAPRPRAAPEVPASPRVPGRVLRHVPRGRRRAAAARVRSRFRLRGMSGARSKRLLTNLCCGMICNRQTSQASLFSMLVI